MGAVKKTSGAREPRKLVPQTLSEAELKAEEEAKRVRLTRRRIRRAKKGKKTYQRWWKSLPKGKAKELAKARILD